MAGAGQALLLLAHTGGFGLLAFDNHTRGRYQQHHPAGRIPKGLYREIQRNELVFRDTYL